MDSGYSQFIRWAKVILPLVALSILATLFLFAERRSGPEGLPLARLEEVVRDEKLTEPRFAGMFGPTGTIEIAAKSLRPALEEGWDLEVDGITLDVTVDENRLNVIGGLALINGRLQQMDVRGLTRLSVNERYFIESRGLNFDLPAGKLTSTSQLEARTPFGSLVAGRMVIAADSEAESVRLEFTGGVKLVYTP
ncbi:MAG: hypothetical protein JJ872_02585 [Marivivens sp.]|nr:hypothetical protein [Marivivens sp.]